MATHLCCVSLLGAGVREDVFLIWREMEEACSTLAQIQRLVAEPSKSDVAATDHGECCFGHYCKSHNCY